MQKVVGSSPIIRSTKTPLRWGFSIAWRVTYRPPASEVCKRNLSMNVPPVTMGAVRHAQPRRPGRDDPPLPGLQVRAALAALRPGRLWQLRARCRPVLPRGGAARAEDGPGANRARWRAGGHRRHAPPPGRPMIASASSPAASAARMTSASSGILLSELPTPHLLHGYPIGAVRSSRMIVFSTRS
jgi:hypothetical protein